MGKRIVDRERKKFLTIIGLLPAGKPSRCAAGCLLVVLATLLIGPGLIRPRVEAAAESVALALTHVTVIDATGAPAQPDMTVVIDRGRIADLGRAAEVHLPDGVQVVDATGKFLIPGLWDMHMHSSVDKRFVLPSMIANGIVGVRDMFGGDLPTIQQRRREIAGGQLLGPHIVTAGPIVDGPLDPWPGALIVKNAAEARAAVDKTKREGADFVKVYSSLSRDAYFAIADEAKKQEIPFAGHVTDTVSEGEASDAGQKSVEHLTGVLLACSTQEDQLRKPLADAINIPEQAIPYKHYDLERALVDTFSEEKAAALFAKMAKNGTWQVPTLITLRTAAFVADPPYRQKFFYNSPRMRYVPYLLKMMWSLALHVAGNRTPSETAINARLFARELAVVGQMHNAGVGILAGTDTPNPFVYPGFSLHDELELLVEAGLTPMEALQAATRSPAVYLGRLDSMGTVEKGKIADLVLLDANPLEDINNTRKINAVILEGKLISRARLDTLLVKIENSRWWPQPAAVILLRMVLHMMRKALYIALAALLAVSFGIYYLLKRRRAARLRTT